MTDSLPTIEAECSDTQHEGDTLASPSSQYVYVRLEGPLNNLRRFLLEGFLKLHILEYIHPHTHLCTYEGPPRRVETLPFVAEAWRPRRIDKIDAKLCQELCD